MLQLLRKIFFYLFVLLYLIVTPCVILYGLGFIFNPREDMPLVQTGLISLATAPRKARIYVNGRRLSERTPALVGDLVPGTYQVRIAKARFQGWEKQIDIQAEKAVALEPVLLLAERPKVENVSTHACRNLAPEVVDGKLLVWEGETLDTLRRFDLFFKRESEPARDLAGAQTIRIRRALTRRDSRVVLFEIENKGKRGYAAVDMDKDREAVTELKGMQGECDHVSWEERSPDFFYCLKDGNLSLYQLSLRKNFPAIARDVLGFGIRHSRLILIKRDFSLVSVTDRGENPEPLVEDPDFSRRLFAKFPQQTYGIEVLKRDLLGRDLLVFHGGYGTLISNRLPYELVSRGVLGTRFSEAFGSEKILFWTEDRVGTIDFNADSDSVFEKGPVQTDLLEKPGKIEQAFWAYDDTHVVFGDGKRIRLLEAKGPKPYLLREVIQSAEDTAFVYQERGHNLYYLDPRTRFLVKRSLTGA